MNCTKCNTEAVKNTALNKEFWYCRSCKDEVFTAIVAEYYNRQTKEVDSWINLGSLVSDTCAQPTTRKYGDDEYMSLLKTLQVPPQTMPWGGIPVVLDPTAEVPYLVDTEFLKVFGQVDTTLSDTFLEQSKRWHSHLNELYNQGKFTYGTGTVHFINEGEENE